MWSCEQCSKPLGDKADVTGRFCSIACRKAYVSQCIQELVERGLLIDSGRRRKGQIVWVALEHALNHPDPKVAARARDVVVRKGHRLGR
jgi:hypothetical protein